MNLALMPDRAQALERTTEAIRELVLDQERAQRNTLEIGRQLAEMIDNQLWRENPELLAYAENSRQRIGDAAMTARHLTARGVPMTPHRACELVAAARFMEHMGSQGVSRDTPCSERQIRSLLRLDVPMAEKVTIWNEAVEKAEGGQPSAAQVQAVIRQHRSTSSQPIPAGGKSQEKNQQRAQARAEKLDKEHEEFRAAVEADGSGAYAAATRRTRPSLRSYQRVLRAAGDCAAALAFAKAQPQLDPEYLQFKKEIIAQLRTLRTGLLELERTIKRTPIGES